MVLNMSTLPLLFRRVEVLVVVTMIGVMIPVSLMAWQKLWRDR